MSSRISIALTAALTIAVLAFLASCKNTDISDEEQSASLAPYSEHRIRGAEIKHYFSGRTAILIGSEGLETNGEIEEASPASSETRDLSFGIEFKRGEPIEVGTAVAIDPRGYFVTAGHCVNGRDIYAMYPNREQKFVIHKIQPVWVRESTLPEIDFALFRVEEEPYGTFKWADLFESGDTVFSAGATFKVNQEEDPSFSLSIDSFAGEVKKSRDVRFDNAKFQLIWHRSPVRRGNSGGPLINENGELVGINYAANSPIQRAAGSEITPMGFAIRPDRNWLRQLIEEDWAEQQGN